MVQLTAQLEEAKEQAARQAQEAVVAYKASSNFDEEVEEVASDFYREGYDDCLKKWPYFFRSWTCRVWS